MSNPFESVGDNTQASRNLNPRLVDWFCWFIAFFPVVLLHGLWLLGWSILGHPPRDRVDYPAEIPGALFQSVNQMMDLACRYHLIAVLFVILFQLISGGRPLSLKWVFAAATVLLFLLTFAAYAWDPVGAFWWFYYQRP